MTTTKLQKRKQSNGTYSLDLQSNPMDKRTKQGIEYIKVKDLSNGAIFTGRNIPSKISCFYNIKPLEIKWKYDISKAEEMCDGDTDYCYLVRDDVFCPDSFYLCLPHNHIVDWRENGLENYSLSPQEFEELEKITMEEYGKIQEKEHITSYENMRDKFATEIA